MAKIKTTLQFSTDELTQMLLERLEETFGEGNVGKITFLVSEESRGYGMGEYTVPSFNGIQVDVKMSMPKGLNRPVVPSGPTIDEDPLNGR